MDRTVFNINLLESLIQFNGNNCDRISKTQSVFTQLCRTCLSETTTQGNIFLTSDTNGPSVATCEKIQILTGLKISEEDKLPHNICTECQKVVDAAYSFRTQTLRIEDVLKRFIKKVYITAEESATEHETISSTVVGSGKIDEPIAIDGYEVSFVGETPEPTPCNVMPPSQPEPENPDLKHEPPDVKKKLFKCGICSKEYTFRNGLHNHLMTAHVQKKVYQCPVCGKMFKKKDRYLQHKKRFCVAPDAIPKVAREPCQITIHPVGEWMTADNFHVEIRNFSCALCDGKFELETDFTCHMQEHLEMKKCPYCKKTFNRPISLENHIRSHTKDKPFVCPLCTKGFCAPRAFRNHLKLHTERKAYVCDTCGKKYISDRELITHLKSHQEEPLSVDLEEFEEAVSFVKRISSTSNHPETSGNVVNSIDLPSTSGLSSKAIEEPEVSSENISSVNNELVCKTEPDIAMDVKTPNEEVVVKKEVIDVSSGSDNEEEVPIPGSNIWNPPPAGFEIFVKEESLHAGGSQFEISNEPLSDDEKSFHQSNHDSTLTPEYEPLDAFDIKVSPDKFEVDPTLTMDDSFVLDPFDQSKQDPSVQPYTSFACSMVGCKMEFKYYRDIINHYTAHHCRGRPPFKCPVCSLTFPLKSDVRSHLKLHLTCEYKCLYCPRAYWQLRDLRIHLRTHTGERPFKCTMCPKRFKQRPALKVHIKTHNICKEYKCDICSKEFFSYNGLFLHSKSHADIKELQCDFCSKQFPTKSRLRRHIDGVCRVRAEVKS